MPSDEMLDTMIDAGTGALAIPISAEWRAAIRMHLAISLGHAANVDAFALPDDADPAPIYTP